MLNTAYWKEVVHYVLKCFLVTFCLPEGKLCAEEIEWSRFLLFLCNTLCIHHLISSPCRTRWGHIGPVCFFFFTVTGLEVNIKWYSCSWKIYIKSLKNNCTTTSMPSNDREIIVLTRRNNAVIAAADDDMSDEMLCHSILTIYFNVMWATVLYTFARNI